MTDYSDHRVHCPHCCTVLHYNKIMYSDGGSWDKIISNVYYLGSHDKVCERRLPSWLDKRDIAAARQLGSQGRVPDSSINHLASPRLFRWKLVKLSSVKGSLQASIQTGPI